MGDFQPNRGESAAKPKNPAIFFAKCWAVSDFAKAQGGNGDCPAFILPADPYPARLCFSDKSDKIQEWNEFRENGFLNNLKYRSDGKLKTPVQTSRLDLAIHPMGHSGTLPREWSFRKTLSRQVQRFKAQLTRSFPAYAIIKERQRIHFCHDNHCYFLSLHHAFALLP